MLNKYNISIHKLYDDKPETRILFEKFNITAVPYAILFKNEKFTNVNGEINVNNILNT